MRHLESEVEAVIPSLLKTEDTYWQPADLLPDLGAPGAFEALRELQERAAALSDELLVVLVGDMITEEALPSYASWISQLDGFDKNGQPKNAWGDWGRKWTAEENRHGDVLNRYLYLSGRVNMREVEITIQNLISDGGDTQTGQDPYKAFTYTSFQEIATNYSHRNVAALARQAGEEELTKLCRFVAGDESRHARAYKLFFKKCLEVDTNEAILAFYDMMRSKVTMPAMYMRERGLKMGETFQKFADIAERLGVYTRVHYAEILESLVTHWDIGNLKGLSPEAEHAQEYLCNLPMRYRKIAERFRPSGQPAKHEFLWLSQAAPPQPELFV